MDYISNLNMLVKDLYSTHELNQVKIISFTKTILRKVILKKYFLVKL